jgi:hypothetical protein
MNLTGGNWPLRQTTIDSAFGRHGVLMIGRKTTANGSIALGDASTPTAFHAR